LALPKLRLFIVPWAAASAPSAPNRQLVTACEVSTLPATTAAGHSGDSIDRGLDRRFRVGLVVDDADEVRGRGGEVEDCSFQWLLRLLGHAEHDSRALAARPAVTHIRY
jgi:hypothetical protein